MNAETLLQSLIEETRKLLNLAENLKTEDLSILIWRADDSSWNILECLEHLNLYGKFYLPEIEKGIIHAKSTPSNEFKSGWLGNYFAQSMLPKEKLNKMKTFKDKNPLNASLNKSTIDDFINQQIKLLDLIDHSRRVNLNSVKIPTSISSLIKMKLGDTFRFYINHMIRHFHQIEDIKIQQGKETIGGSG